MVVQKGLQNRIFASGSIRLCSPLFVWVGVLLVYRNFVQHQGSRAQHKRWCQACWKGFSQMASPLERARSRHWLACSLLYFSPPPILSVLWRTSSSPGKPVVWRCGTFLEHGRWLFRNVALAPVPRAFYFARLAVAVRPGNHRLAIRGDLDECPDRGVLASSPRSRSACCRWYSRDAWICGLMPSVPG